jgi:hypothetical protein
MSFADLIDGVSNRLVHSAKGNTKIGKVVADDDSELLVAAKEIMNFHKIGIKGDEVMDVIRILF